MTSRQARHLVVVGGSAGGLEPLSQLVRELPADLPAAVLAVIHFPASARTRLATILDRAGSLPSAVASDGEPLLEGRIYVPPSDHHVLVHRGRVRLSHAPRENGHRPAIDPLFRSAARSYGEAATGVVLCGLLDDGSAGLLAIRRAGGASVVLDPDTCVFADMPRNAVAVARPDHVLPIDEIAATVERLVRGSTAGNLLDLAGMRAMERSTNGDQEAGTMAPPNDEPWGDDQPGRPSGFTCPECHGVLWEIEQPADVPLFACRIGHRVSAETLLELRYDEIENALWASVRALEEQASLATRLSDRATTRRDNAVADRFRRRADEARRQADVVRALATLPRVEPEPADADAGHLER